MGVFRTPIFIYNFTFLPQTCKISSMENKEIDVLDYIQSLKKEHITAIRLLEVDVARKFDEILFILKTMAEQSSTTEESDFNLSD